MAEKKKSPEIRFKEFDGEWEEKKLGDICLIGDIDHRMPQSVTNGIPYIMTGGFVGINGLDFDNSKLISTEDYEQLSKKIKPETGDILFARYASVGVVRYVETQIKFLVSYSCAILKHNDTHNGKYLFYYLQSNNAQHQIELEINTGSQRNIGIDSLKKLLIHLPKEKEQVEVAKLLSNLDKLITLHKRKYAKLATIKKAMLEKMFPKKGAGIPEIRFKGFTEAWEVRNFGDILKVYPFKPYISEPELDGIFEVIQQGKNPIVGFANGKPFENFKQVVLFGDHTLSLYKPNMPFFVASDGVKILGMAEELNGEYFYALFIRNKPVTEGYKRHFSILREISISITINTKEQALIGAYFKHLDNLITLHQNELGKLKNIKKAYFEKMFV